MEFIGFEQWTPQMIQERSHYRSTGQFRYSVTDLKKTGVPDAVVFAGRGCKKVECP
jgi:hypothetical protein